MTEQLKELDQPLAHGPTGMLHIFPPWLNTVLGIILLILLLVILLWAVLYFLARRRAAAPIPSAPRRPARAAQEIDMIFSVYSKKQAYRDGCHELSSFLRRYYERMSGEEIEEMTAREIQHALGRKNPGKLFFHLAELQFSEEDVSPDDFKKICTESKNAVHGLESNRETQAT